MPGLMRSIALACSLILAVGCAAEPPEETPPGATPDEEREPAHVELITEMPSPGGSDPILDFGEVDDGDRAVRELGLRNSGGSDALARFAIRAPFQIEGDEFRIPAGGELRVPITFRAERPGRSEVVLYIDGPDQELQVRLVGTTVPGCEVALSAPSELGRALVGQTSEHEVTMRNNTDRRCAVALSTNGSPAFLLDREFPAVLAENEVAVRKLAFTPTEVGEAALTLSFYVEGVLMRHTPVVAEGVTGCAAAAEAQVDFGSTPAICGEPLSHTLQIRNDCAHAISGTVRFEDNDVWTFSTSASSIEIPPNAQESLELGFHPRYDRGEVDASLVLTLTGGEVHTIALHGMAASYAGMTGDSFEPDPEPPLDVLLVVDGTILDEPFASRFDEWLIGLVDTLALRGAQVGVVSSNATVESGCFEAGGRLAPVFGETPRLVPLYEHDAPLALEMLRASVRSVALCDQGRSIENGLQAFSYPVIDNADDPRTPATHSDGNRGLERLGVPNLVILLSAQDDHSGYTTEWYQERLADLASFGENAWMALVATEPGCDGATAGTRFRTLLGEERLRSICGEKWPAFEVPALEPQRRFYLSDRPLDMDEDGRYDGPGELEVLVDGAVPAVGWVYEEASNRITFAMAPGGTVEARYPYSCSSWE